MVPHRKSKYRHANAQIKTINFIYMKTNNLNLLISILFLVNFQIVKGQKSSSEDWLISKPQEISVGEKAFECLPQKGKGQANEVRKIYDYIMPGDLFSALNEEARGKVIALSEEIDKGKDPTFKAVSAVFPDYMKYPKAIVGVKEHLDRFLSSWDGAIVYPPMYISFEINDTPFGKEDEKNLSRSLLDNSYLPVVVTKYKYDGLQYEQTILGYSKDFKTENPLIAFVRMKVKNPSAQPKKTKLTLWFRGTGVRPVMEIYGLLWWSSCGDKVIHCPRKLSMESNKILDENGNIVLWSDLPGVSFEGDRLSFELSLNPGEEKELHLRIPHRAFSNKDINLLSDPSFDEVLGKLRTFWDEALGHGMKINVPEEIINKAYKTWHINNFLLVREMNNKWSQSYMTTDAPFFYESVCGYAASMYLNTLTTGGYYEEAKKTAAMFIRLQRPDGALSGDAAIVPHQHGSILYTISQLYRKGRDDEWFRTMAPDLIKACDWIINERAKSMALSNESKTVAYGLLPEYRYCEDLTTGVGLEREYLGNAWCWAGLNEAATALSELGGEFNRESKRLKMEADQYRADILTSMDKAVIKQNGLTFLPMVVTNKEMFADLKQSRRAHYYNILAPRMLESEFFDRDDERIRWVPDFLDKRGGVILGVARFGGDAWGIDPHFIGGYGVTNLRLDNIPKFLLTYYGLASYGMSRTLFSTQESSDILNENNPEWHSLRQPHLHSTSELIRLTNMMLVKEEDEELWLAWGVPRKWLEDGKETEVKKAQTCFGPVDYRIESHVSAGYIKAELSASITKQPSVIRLKLRHPDQKKIKKVEVNGKKWKDYDGETINLDPSGGNISVVAYY